MFFGFVRKIGLTVPLISVSRICHFYFLKMIFLKMCALLQLNPCCSFLYVKFDKKYVTFLHFLRSSAVNVSYFKTNFIIFCVVFIQQLINSSKISLAGCPIVFKEVTFLLSRQKSSVRNIFLLCKTWVLWYNQGSSIGLDKLGKMTVVALERNNIVAMKPGTLQLLFLFSRATFFLFVLAYGPMGSSMGQSLVRFQDNFYLLL